MLRTTTRSTAGWVFGLAATILFISLWGRAIVVDTDKLAESAAPLSGSVAVVALFADWLTSELEDNGVDPSLARPAVQYVLETSEVGSVIDEFVGEVVEAAAVPDAQGAVVDIAGLLAPAVADISNTLTSAGVAVDRTQVASVVEGLDALVIRQPGTTPFVGASSPMASRLGTAAGLAVLTMMLAGWLAVLTSKDRLIETRRLATRVALGGLSFGILLKGGAWVLDPGGGRAPISESISLLFASKWLVPLSIGLVSAGLAMTIWGVRRLLRPPAENLTPVEQSRRLQEQRQSMRV